jgi:hypothetical protein
MRFAFVSEPEMESWRSRCTKRSAGTKRSAARVVDTEPEDAVKARVAGAHLAEMEPTCAAKGDPATSTPGVIQC